MCAVMISTSLACAADNTWYIKSSATHWHCHDEFKHMRIISYKFLEKVGGATPPTNGHAHKSNAGKPPSSQTSDPHQDCTHLY